MGLSTKGPITPWKDSWAHKQEIARDIRLMHENIREGYMPKESQEVIDTLVKELKEL